MPDANGRIRPVSVPDVPWCRTCKLVECACRPAACEEHCEDRNMLCSCGRCSCVGCVCAGDEHCS